MRAGGAVLELRLPLSPARVPRVPSGRGANVGCDLPGIFCARHGDLRALGEAGKAGRDHPLAGLQALADHGAHVVLLGQLHAPDGDGVVVLEHIDEGAVGAALDGGGRHHNDGAQRVDQHPHIDELAGPELQIGVGKLTLDLHRAGGLIDLVVDHHHLAGVERALAVGRQGLDRQLAFGHAPGEIGQVLLRQAEEDRDRPQLRQDHDAGGVRTAYEVAFVHETDAGAAGDRRDHVGVAQDGARVVDRGLVELDLRLELADRRPLGVELLLVDGVGRRQSRIAIEIEPGVGELRLVLRFLRLRLVVLRLVGRRIDLGEDESLGDVLSLRERDVDDLAVDLRANGHGVERFRGADAVEIDRHVGCTRGDGEDGHGIGRGRAAAATAFRRRLRLLPLRHVIHGDDAGDDEAGNQQHRESALEHHRITFALAPTPPAPTPGGIQLPPSA